MDKLFEDIVSAFGVSGHESEVRDIICQHLDELGISYEVDPMGNVIVKAGCESALAEDKYMIVAHMDTFGFVVTYVEESGFLRIAKVGEFDEAALANSLVEFENGNSGRLCISKKDGSIDDMYIDLGVGSRDEALELVEVGDVCMASSNVIEEEKNIIAPCLDNRAGCYAVLKALEKAVSDKKMIERTDKQFIFVFSVQNCLGARGARAAAFAEQPMYSIVIDGECAGDAIGAKGRLSLGKGTAIKFMDKTLVMHHEIKEKLEKAYENIGVKPQYVFGEERSDGYTLHKEGLGVKTGTIVYPVRYMGTNAEMVSYKDIEETASVVAQFIKDVK